MFLRLTMERTQKLSKFSKRAELKQLLDQTMT